MAHNSLLRSFENLDIAPGEFRHCDHVEVAFEMLALHSFMEAASRYTQTIKAMATAADHPEKFNLTITLAFLGVIAERMSNHRGSDYATFIQLNQDLLERDVLARWYCAEQLNSDIAREIFLLPDLPRTRDAA